jgi:hypothetical protein
MVMKALSASAAGASVTVGVAAGVVVAARNPLAWPGRLADSTATTVKPAATNISDVAADRTLVRFIA